MASPLLKKIAVIAACALVRANVSVDDASCPDDELPELMKVQLLQSDISVRRARARATQARQAQAGEITNDASGSDAVTQQQRSLAVAADNVRGAVPGSVEVEDGDSLLAVLTGTPKLEADDSEATSSDSSKALKASQPAGTASATPKPRSSVFQVAMSAILARHATTVKFWEQHIAGLAPHNMPTAALHALEQPGLGVPATSGRTATPLAHPTGAEGMLDRLRAAFDIPDVPTDGISFEYLVAVRVAALGAFTVQVAIDLAFVVSVSIVYVCLVKAPPARLDRADEGETWRESVINAHGGWSHSLWGCCEAPAICLCSCFCPAVRWSETMSYVPALAFCCFGQHQMVNFWFWLMFILAATVSASFLLFPLHDLVRVLMLPMLLAVFRYQLRGRFSIERGAGVCIRDCVLYSCCLCCTLTQDARLVEDAVKKGLDGALVGEPVSLGAPSPSAVFRLEGEDAVPKVEADSEKPTEA